MTTFFRTPCTCSKNHQILEPKVNKNLLVFLKENTRQKINKLLNTGFILKQTILQQT